MRLPLFFVLLFAARIASGSMVISVSYTGDPQYATSFASAATTWQSILGGYRSGLVIDTTAGSSAIVGQAMSTVLITASIGPIDGGGLVLAQASPSEIALDNLGFYLATDGFMEFDSADIGVLSPAQLDSLVLHEMAHVLGFGTLWGLNGVYNTGSGEFTGPQASSTWQSDFGQTGNPDVELEGGPGTANAHWNEMLGGAGLTGITDSLGRDMRDELMTGWLNPNSFISSLTVASFRDIGFSTVSSVPEPSSFVTMAIGCALGLAIRYRKPQR